MGGLMMSSGADAELAHGYTLGEVGQLAKTAVRHAGPFASDYTDRLDAAYGAILIALYEAPHWPTRHTLIGAGMRAVAELVNADAHAYGYRQLRPGEDWAGTHSAPRHVTYWRDLTAPTASPETRIVERVAVRQVLPALTILQREAVAALAATGDYREAAGLLGVSQVALYRRVDAARRRVLALWFEGETPPRRRTDRRVGSRTTVRPSRCPRGHAYEGDNLCPTRSGALRCRTCVRERSRDVRAGVVRLKVAPSPCGTHAAWWRHRRRGEDVDPACEAARRTYLDGYAAQVRERKSQRVAA